MSKKNNQSNVGSAIHDPMIIILVSLLIFLTIGTAFFSSGSTGRVVIELDAAYGGDASGYEGIITESAFNEKAVDALEEVLSNDIRFTVLRTHESGTSASVEEKAAKINEDQPDLVISIHCAYAPDASISGMSVYPDIPSSANHEKSLAAANAIANAFTSDTWTPAVYYLYYKPYGENAYQIETVETSDTSDHEEETWALLEAVDVPAVVVEQIYCSSQNDVDMWANEDGYQKIADTYYSALKTLYGFDS